nr:beta-1,3-galactosyltransferase 1-like [Solea senegalensis]
MIRKNVQYIFLGTLAVMIIFIVYLNFDQTWEIWNNAVRMNITNFVFLASQTPEAPLTTISTTEEPHWEDPGPFHVAYPRNYKFIMDDTPVCKTRDPFVILMVPVAPGEVKVRDAIRETWGNEKIVLGQVVDTLFILGRPGGADAEQVQEKLQQENQEHHDLIQSNFRDSYYNLTIKSLVMLEWLVANCKNSAYFIKIDSDTLLHVPNLVKLLLDPSTAKQNYMSGLVWWHSPVIRDSNNRFFLPPEIIAEPEYPPYPLGMAYVMSLDLPRKLLGISTQIKPIYIEDAYLGMCLKRLGISPTEPPAPGMYLVAPTHPLSNCSLSKAVVVMTTGIPLMKNYWERTKDPDLTC